MADSKKYDGSQWEHSLRKLTTATEAVENPLYSDGTAITSYTIKGNEEHTGTPSPQNPVMPNGVGNKTANLFNKNATNTANGYVADSRLNGGAVETNSECNVSEYIPVDGATTYTMSGFYAGWSSSLAYYDTSKSIISYQMYENKRVLSFTTPANAAYIRITISKPDIDTTMINDGSVALPYEPYGYKIPISSGQQTTNIYLGSTQTLRAIGKRVYDGTENWALHGGLSNVFWIDDYQDGYVDNTVSNFALSSEYVQRQYNAVASLSNGQFVYGTPSGSSTKRILMKNTNCATKEDWIAYLQTQYAAGTPVTVWYVLATSQTGTVNEPLMKIGTYADTLSNATAIPTTEGANSITVDTTVQPSEFTATWTGWHDASVKEKSENLWDEDYTNISSDIYYKPVYVGDYEIVTVSSTVPLTSQNYANLFALGGQQSSGASTGDNGVYSGRSMPVRPIDGYITIAYRNANGINPQDYDTMVNEGRTAQTYAPYWE